MPVLLTREILRTLRANGELTLHGRGDHRPVVKIINPYGLAIWLLSELDTTEPDHLYGILDLGQGRPELGWVSRDGLETAYVQRGEFKVPLARDVDFVAAYPLAVYMAAARAARAVTECPAALDAAAARLAHLPTLRERPPAPAAHP